jgi:hypothetical protein
MLILGVLELPAHGRERIHGFSVPVFSFEHRRRQGNLKCATWDVRGAHEYWRARGVAGAHWQRGIGT